MIKVTRAIALMALGVAVSGCATAVRGTSQSIPVGSTPEGAECTFTRAGQMVGRVTTPGSIRVSRDQRAIDVVCTKEGHEEARAVMNSLKDGSPYIYTGVGIISLVSAIGSLTDHASGATNSYQTALMVKLEPLSEADKAARAAAPPVVATAAAGSPPSAAVTPPAPPVRSGPWQARSVLIPESSRQSCARDGGAYWLDVSGDSFIVDNVNGRMLVTTLPADGKVDQSFRSPSGSRLAIVGNARTRELEIVNADGGCRWKLTPQS